MARSGLSRRTVMAAGGAAAAGRPQLWISPAQTGGIGDGVADDHDALAAAMALQQPIWLEGRTWRLSRPLETGDHDLILIGPGALLFPRAAPALVFNPPWGPTAAISEMLSGSRQGSPVTGLRIGRGSDFQAGDVVQVRSSDPLTTEPTTQRAEVASVLAVEQDVVWLTLRLQDRYPTRPLLQRLPSRRLQILQWVGFRCYEDIEARGGARTGAALIIEGAREPLVQADIADSPSRGVFALSCWRGVFEIRARRLRDDVQDKAYGYGVSLAGASRYNHVEVRAERCRHAFTTNVYTPLAPAWFGSPRDNWVTGEAVRCSSAAFDTHPGAFDIHFYGLKVAAPAPDAERSGDGERFAFQDRAVRTTLDGLEVTGFTGGLYCRASAGEETPYVNRYRGVWLAASPRVEQGPQPTGLVCAGGAGWDRMTIEVYDSLFDGCSVNWSTPAQRTSFFRTRFRNLERLYVAEAEVALRDCQRDNDTGHAQEPISARGGAELLLAGVQFSGDFGGACVRSLPGGTGAVRLQTAQISAWPRGPALFAAHPSAPIEHQDLTVARGPLT